MMMRYATMALLTALAGCTEAEPPSNDAAAQMANVAVANQAKDLTAVDAVPIDGDNAVAPGAGAAVIPAALRGRWGLVPEDCTSDRGDEKGLLIVEDTRLRFYESRAILGRIIEQEAHRLEAEFAFEGEGQTWQRRMAFDLEEDGQALIRRDFGDDAMPEPLTYKKCKA